MIINYKGKKSMSEKIDNSKYRKTKLKEFILKLHGGESQKTVFNGFQSKAKLCFGLATDKK